MWILTLVFPLLINKNALSESMIDTEWRDDKTESFYVLELLTVV